MSVFQFLLAFIPAAAATSALAAGPSLAERAREKYPRALDALVKQADAALGQPPLSVMDKTGVGPSGDKHDYFTPSPYHWPNPDAPDGLPYVMRDGKLNPDATTDKYDRARYFKLGATVKTLCLAYCVTGNEGYAKQAAAWVRGWFLDPATCMSPNFEYAQVVPGREGGNRSGIIRGTLIVELIAAIHRLDSSPHWTEPDRQAWIGWQRAYLDWLLESELGRAESRAMNNHGTWYDVQVATLAMECGDTARAREVLAAAPQRRIGPQVSRDGRQPFELVRTKSWDYSVFNLDALFHLARLARPLEIDLWNWKSPKSAGMRGAIDDLLPYATGQRAWKSKQIRDFDAAALYPLLVEAAIAYDEPRYAEAAAAIPGFDPANSVEALGLMCQ